MYSSITLNDSAGSPVTLHAETGKRQVRQATGLVGIGPVRNDQKRPLPQAHGAINTSRWEDGATVTLEGAVMSSIGQVDAFAEFRTIVAPMMQTLDVGPALLKWTEGPAGNALQMLVKLDSDVEPAMSEGAALIQYQAQFFAEDPRAYSQTLTTVSSAALSVASGGKVYPRTYPRTYAPSGGGTVAFTNAGNRPTPPVFRIFGGCVNPQIVLIGSGKRIVLNGTVANGDFLELDTFRRTVKLNGTTLRHNFYDAASSQWFELPAGLNNLQLVASSFDASARLDVLARSAYA